METQLEYGNWIRKKILLALGLCALATGALALVPLGLVYRAIVGLLFAIVLISFLIPLYSFVMFSQKGGRFQEKVYDLIIGSLGAIDGGRVLDIGSGNGVLAVRLAQQLEPARVTGMDYWGEDWEYSRGVCEKNARIGGVEQRVHFQKGDAAALEFADGAFDCAISNLTFHEVRSARDKREVLREALRVVKPGGRFAFVDYFYDAKLYGNEAELDQFLRGLGLSQLDRKPLWQLMAVPWLLRHPRILGKVGMISGRK
jgi:SAM-dependent methyltransferase